MKKLWRDIMADVGYVIGMLVLILGIQGNAWGDGFFGYIEDVVEAILDPINLNYEVQDTIIAMAMFAVVAMFTSFIRHYFKKVFIK